MNHGAFCISIDLERGWGIWDQPDADYFEHCIRLETEIVSRLLEMFAQYKISATWAIVGRLLERSDDPDRQDASLWFGSQDIEKIRSAIPTQDIGTHSFSHIYCGEATDLDFAADLNEARRVHDANGLPFCSMVFPRNKIGNLALLKSVGIKVFRGVDRGFHMAIRKRFGHWPGRIANLLDKFIPLPASVVHPVEHPDGLVELPGSMLLLSRQGIRGWVPPKVMLLKAQWALGLAQRRSGVFHLWFHPSNFYYDTERQFAIFRKILARAAHLRDYHGLQISPMSSFAVEAKKAGRVLP